MGATGIGVFEEDFAMDWLIDLCDREDPREFLEESLVLDDELELDVCSAVLAACTIIDGLLNGPKRSLPSEAKEWLKTHKKLAVKRMLKSAIQGLDAVLSERSEACGLWKENREYYSKWRRSTLSLRKRLEQHLPHRKTIGFV
jgi:hypothetical protein